MLKRAAKWIIDRSLLPLVRYIAERVVFTVRGIDTADPARIVAVKFSEVPLVKVDNLAPDLQHLDAWRYPKLMTRVTQIEVEKSVELIQKHLDHVHLAPSDRQIREYSLKHVPPDGLLLEFGVFDGASTNFLASDLTKRGDPRTLHGFDSFEGLSEDGSGWTWQKGRFDRGGRLPKVPSNVRLHKGWIDDTLPVFLQEHPDDAIAFIHVDVDIYAPAKTILTLCKPRLRSGSIVLFDELLGYAGWRFHEYKALTEVFNEDEYEFIAFSDFYQATIRIK